MDAQQFRGIGALSMATAITEVVCDLPAVATLSWGDRAAEALGLIASPCWSCIMIGTLDTSGALISHEATGVSQRGFSGSDTARSAELTLRSKTERIQDTGLRLNPADLRVGVTGTLPSLLGGDVWRTRGLGQLWSDIAVRDVILSAQKLGSIEAGRVLIAMVGLADANLERATEEQIAVMKVTMPLLVRRALMAIGARRTTSSRWLTVREEQVLNELTLGKSVRQIAEELGRSPHTIHDHVKSLHRKLNASSRGELVARALGYLDEGQRIRDRSIPSEQRQPEIQTTAAAQMPARQPLANALNGARQESPAAEIGIPAG
ncbi:MAG: helix-turn-helix transcriptional regulator, partial [Planctomycetota bacterium]